ncbi:unnamed protein product [Brassica oleracea var. botrytis]
MEIDFCAFIHTRHNGGGVYLLKAPSFMRWRLSGCQSVLDQNDKENGGSSAKAHACTAVPDAVKVNLLFSFASFIVELHYMPFHIGERQNTPIVFLRQTPPETPRKKTTLPSIERKIESVHQSRLSPKKISEWSTSWLSYGSKHLLVNNLVTQLSPSKLKTAGAPVHRCVPACWRVSLDFSSGISCLI